MMTRAGEIVTVHGQSYRVMRVENAATAGSRWAGKFVFILRDSEGGLWRALGRRLMHNSRLSPHREYR